MKNHEVRIDLTQSLVADSTCLELEDLNTDIPRCTGCLVFTTLVTAVHAFICPSVCEQFGSFCMYLEK